MFSHNLKWRILQTYIYRAYHKNTDNRVLLFDSGTFITALLFIYNDVIKSNINMVYLVRTENQNKIT